MRPLMVVPLLLGLAACGSHPKSAPEPIIKTVEVVVPKAVGCVPSNVSDAPNYPDTDESLRAAPDAASRYQLLYAGRKVRTARLGELEPIVASCPKADHK